MIRADEWEAAEAAGVLVGSIGQCAGPIGRRPPRREFPPGFHGAAPGPSHDEEPAPRPRKPRPAAKAKPRPR